MLPIELAYGPEEALYYRDWAARSLRMAVNESVQIRDSNDALGNFVRSCYC